MEGVDTYKRLRKNPLSVIGKAEYRVPPPAPSQWRPVVTGFFTLVDGQGIPLDIVLGYFHGNGMDPDWLDFFMESLQKGWNPRSTLTKIQVACEDVYGFEHASIVVDKLKAHIGYE